MKNKTKKIVCFLILILSFISLTSCNFSLLRESNSNKKTDTVITKDDGYEIKPPKETGDYKVTYICNNGYTTTIPTTKDNKVLKPSDPTKKFHTFVGWYKDVEYQTQFNFKQVLTENTTIYAYYEADYISLYNEITNTVLLSSLEVKVEHKNLLGQVDQEKIGSGIIFKEDDMYYYLLTNHHVVYYDNKTLTKPDISVIDCYQNVSSAEVIAKDVNYDLALLKFKKEKKLYVSTVADYDIYRNEVVFAIGNPKGFRNKVTMGKLFGQKTNKPAESTKELSNVTFDIYYSSCPIDKGSSGGGLFDSNLNLVGINFASTSDDGKFVSCDTIPSSKIKEFTKNHLI